MIEELIARLEAAAEGSRELDNAIFDMLHPPRTASAGEEEPPPDFGEPPDDFGRWTPEYTTSLDTAMTLVPKGWSREVGTFYRDHLDKPLVHARVANDADGIEDAKKGACIVEGEAATEPLAICLAALQARARASLSTPEGVR